MKCSQCTRPNRPDENRIIYAETNGEGREREQRLEKRKKCCSKKFTFSPSYSTAILTECTHATALLIFNLFTALCILFFFADLIVFYVFFFLIFCGTNFANEKKVKEKQSCLNAFFPGVSVRNDYYCRCQLHVWQRSNAHRTYWKYSCFFKSTH